MQTPQPDLIPREVLFANPEKALPQISPDGERLAYLASSGDGVLNVWVRGLDADDDRQVTADTENGIWAYSWSTDGRRLLYFQDRQGDEVQHLHSVELESGVIRDLTPFIGVRAQNLLTHRDFPDEVLVGTNLRDRRVFDMHRIDLRSGAVTLDTENPGDVLSWATDARFRIRACSAILEQDASTLVRVRDSDTSPWCDLHHVPFEESTQYAQMNGGGMVVGFSRDGTALYLVSSRGAPTARLLKVDARTGAVLEVLAEDTRCDVEAFTGADGGIRYAVLSDPETGAPRAVGFDPARLEWQVLDPGVERDFAALRSLGSGVFHVVSRDRADRRWVIQVIADDGPQQFFLYDRAAREARLLFADQPRLASYRLAEMAPITLQARDGLELPGYLTLPPGVPAIGLPLVLCPHGGPWWRDRWGFDPVSQLLANRGYAVLQVNFRGSAGFGARFLNAGNGEWGTGAMQHDLTDAVRWAVEQGIADPSRVGIIGGSYGGYAALSGIAFTPELYACAVDLVGPSDLRTLRASMPEYWAPVKRRWLRRAGDVEHDDELNRRISPLYHAGRIRAPLLIGHGANDPRVPLAQSEEIARTMRARGLEVTLVVYPDEGHGFSRPENNLDFFGRVEEFLARHLGGRCEPWRAVPGSSARLVENH